MYQGQVFIQIVFPDGGVVKFAGGGNPPRAGTLEADLLTMLSDEITKADPLPSNLEELIAACVDDIVSRGVGMFRTEAHVKQDIRDGLHAVLARYKYTPEAVRLELVNSLHESMRRALQKFKDRTVTG